MKDIFTMRAVQMDLARQMETVDSICDFIDFIAKYGYNTLFLYLEWRIRTDTFDMGEACGYTKEEIRRIVTCAAKYGIEVIPGLACFGHAEQVLTRPEYEDMAELRGGTVGREHSNFRHVFCLTNPRVRDFIASYLAETVELFPSGLVHTGFDEALDVGYCPECRQAAGSFEAEQQLVLNHLKFCRDVLMEKHGKRMMIWDDLLPLYSSFLKTMPKDILICSWQYQQNVPAFCSYCFNAGSTDTLRQFAAEGFQFVIVPCDFSLTGAETFSSWGKRTGAWGGLLSAWDKKTFFLERTKLNVAATGLLWSGQAASMEMAFDLVLRDIFGEMPQEFSMALVLTRCAAYRIDLIQNRAALLHHAFFGPDDKELRATELAYAILRPFLEQFSADSPSWRILRDILSEAKCRALSLRSKKAAYRMLHRLDGESLSSIAREIPTAFEPMIQMCGKLRRECDKSPFITARDNWVRTLRELETELTRPHTLCRVMFCLPLTYGNTLTTFKSYRQGRETLIGSGNFKIANTYETYSAHFEWFFLLPADFDADTLRIEAEGFTGTGISFVTFTTPDAELTVDGIRSISGEVANPQHLLSETDTFCYFGSQDGFHATVDRKAGEIVHCVELSLRKTSRRKQKDE